MKIVLARHGQTTANRDGFIMGRTDAPLTRQGLETVNDMSRIIGLERVQRILSSSLGRAALTAATYSHHLRVPLSFRESMAELSCGSWEGRHRADVIAGSGPIRSTWQFRPPGGESYQDGETRVASLMEEILGQTDGKTVLVVGHASVNRVFIKLILGLDPVEAMTIRSPHDTVYVIEPGRDIRYVSGSGLSDCGFLRESE